MIDCTTLCEHIRTLLSQELSLTALNIVNESHLHANHPQRPKNQYHLALTLASPELNGLTRVKQHQWVYRLLAPLMQQHIHALKINIVHKEVANGINSITP